MHKYTKHYNYLQAYWQKLQKYFYIYKKYLKSQDYWSLGRLKLFMRFGLSEITSHFSQTFNIFSFFGINHCMIHSKIQACVAS